MATVVGTDPAAVKRVTCLNCAAIIEYTPADCTEKVERDYTGDGELVRRLACPRCHNSIQVSRR